MPPHPVYCEPFLGGGAVMRLKRPAPYNIGVDLDSGVIAAWRSRAGENAASAGRAGESAAGGPQAEMPRAAARNLVATVNSPGAAAAGESAASRRRRTAEAPPLARGGEVAACGSAAESSSFRFLRGDGLTFLASYPFQPTDLIYCDPPYLMETRSSGRLYKHEMSDDQHVELLGTILELPCRVMISGYWSQMYNQALKGWNRINFMAMTRGGMAEEWLWFNYAKPVELHDYRFLGENTRKRQDLRRQIASWAGKLERMPALKKQALLAAIAGHGESAAGIPV
jgi:hypothetical protein